MYRFKVATLWRNMRVAPLTRAAHELRKGILKPFLFLGFYTNVCFCVGPCVEDYVSRVGMDRRAARLA